MGKRLRGNGEGTCYITKKQKSMWHKASITVSEFLEVLRRKRKPESSLTLLVGSWRRRRKKLIYRRCMI